MATRRKTPPPEDPTPVGDPTPLLILIALLLMRFVLVLATDLISWTSFHSSGSAHPMAMAMLASNVWIVPIDIITIIVVVLMIRRERVRFATLFQPRMPWRDTWLSLVMFAVFAFAFVLGTYIANLLVYQGPAPSTSDSITVSRGYAIWAVTVMPLTIAVAQELAYRGFLQPRFQARLGYIWGIVIVACGFALEHTAFALTDVRAVIARLIAMLIVGLIIGTLYARIKRLAPFIIGHWLLNLFALGVPFLLATMEVR